MEWASPLSTASKGSIYHNKCSSFSLLKEVFNSVGFFFPPRGSRWGGCCKKHPKPSTILYSGKCILSIWLEIWKDTLIILSNYIPVRGEYIYIFNIQLISNNSFDQIDMPFILKRCAKISSLDSLMCEVMNLFSSLLQHAFHFSLQIKTPTLLTSVLPLLNTIFKCKRNHTPMVPSGFCLLTFSTYRTTSREGKLMALCLQTKSFSKWTEMSTYLFFPSVTYSSVPYKDPEWPSLSPCSSGLRSLTSPRTASSGLGLLQSLKMKGFILRTGEKMHIGPDRSQSKNRGSATQSGLRSVTLHMINPSKRGSNWFFVIMFSWKLCFPSL